MAAETSIVGHVCDEFFELLFCDNHTNHHDHESTSCNGSYSFSSIIDMMIIPLLILCKANKLKTGEWNKNNDANNNLIITQGGKMR